MKVEIEQEELELLKKQAQLAQIYIQVEQFQQNITMLTQQGQQLFQEIAQAQVQKNEQTDKPTE